MPDHLERHREVHSLHSSSWRMHFLVSFIGTVGANAADSGLTEVLESTFLGVAKMLSGIKCIPAGDVVQLDFPKGSCVHLGMLQPNRKNNVNRRQNRRLEDKDEVECPRTSQTLIISADLCSLSGKCPASTFSSGCVAKCSANPSTIA